MRFRAAVLHAPGQPLQVETIELGPLSSHAEYCVVPESGAIRVPAAIPFDRACLIGCGVMTGD